MPRKKPRVNVDNSSAYIPPRCPRSGAAHSFPSICVGDVPEERRRAPGLVNRSLLPKASPPYQPSPPPQRVSTTGGGPLLVLSFPFGLVYIRHLISQRTANCILSPCEQQTSVRVEGLQAMSDESIPIYEQSIDVGKSLLLSFPPTQGSTTWLQIKKL